MDRQTELGILAGAEIFRSVPSDALDEIRQAAFRKRYARGELVFHQGESVATFYVVAVGRLRVSQATADGTQVIMAYLGPGEMAGYAALSGGETYSGTVSAVDDSALIGWTRDAIQALMARHPKIAMNAVAILGNRYHETQVRLRELATESVEQRIAHAIERLAAQAGRRSAQGIEIAFPLTRQDLAELAATTLHTVSRTLSTWEKQGIVLSGRRRVVICRPDTLNAIAEGPG